MCGLSPLLVFSGPLLKEKKIEHFISINELVVTG